MSSQSKDERYTPIKYIKSVKKVLGRISLDPASNEIANKRIKANKIFTIEDNGLQQTWFGNIFCNPPYSRGNLIIWSRKIVEEFEAGNFCNGIYLVPNATDTDWFKTINKYPFCAIDHRINFLQYNKMTNKFYYMKNPENGSCFFLFTNDNYVRYLFCKEFAKFGPIFMRIT